MCIFIHFSFHQAFEAFDEILGGTDRATARKFMDTVNQSLVDSNMFVRALILSLEHFLKHREDVAPDYSVEQSRLLSFIADFQTQIFLLVSLVKIINVENLTQENVSCLNTTLVFLMFANQKAQLPKYLRGIEAMTVTRRNALTNEVTAEKGTALLKNFRDLLLFWQEHYLHKDKDCSALERSSKIPFDYWKSTVSTLVCADRSLDTSLAHYLPVCDVANATGGACVKPRAERDP